VISAGAAMTGTYDPLQVALSVPIAVSASYAALDLAGRVIAASGRTRLAWLIGGSTAMGIGIWATHYIGMLAFHFPQEPESRPPCSLRQAFCRDIP
jgi:NO-binding membrane sensor protein with MHYT domain